MNSQKGFVIPIIIAIVATFAIGGGYYYSQKIGITTTPESPSTRKIDIATTTQNNIVGGDKDSHGCIGSAGYSWCEIKNKCLRVWEEKCEVVSTTTININKDWQTYKNEEYGFEFKYPKNWKIVDTHGGPIVSVAPEGYVIKDGTDSPYGFFFVWPFGFNLSEGMKLKRLNMPLDTGWSESFGGEMRQVITSNKKLEITMFFKDVLLEEILSTFKFTK